MFIITEVDGNPVFSLVSMRSFQTLWRYDSQSDQFVTYSVNLADWRDVVMQSVGLGYLTSQNRVVVNPLRKIDVGFKAYVI